MPEGAALRCALGLQDVVVHGLAFQEPLLGFGDPMLEVVAQAELHRRRQDPVVGAHPGPATTRSPSSGERSSPSS
eukprot:9922224-Alexandrium_andersonii.AAC.1